MHSLIHEELAHTIRRERDSAVVDAHRQPRASSRRKILFTRLSAMIVRIPHRRGSRVSEVSTS